MSDGWNRGAQDERTSLEAELQRSVPPSDSEDPSFLNRRVGFVSGRWVFVLLGGIVGAAIGSVATVVLIRGQTFFGNPLVLAFPIAGFAVGGLIAGLILLLLRDRPKRPLRERVADLIALR